jgi:hypothetical protein
MLVLLLLLGCHQGGRATLATLFWDAQERLDTRRSHLRNAASAPADDDAMEDEC